MQNSRTANRESTDEISQPKHRIIRESKVPVPMRDGVNLGGEIYRPDAPGKFPVLMVLRYFRGGHQNSHGEFFAPRGYVVALIDSRGRGDSEGKWVPYINEPRDGYDAQQWLGKQSWCNGNIGTFGISYNGFTQCMSAPLGSCYLKCLAPQESQQTNFGHLYNDGVMQLNVVFEFGLFTRGKLQTQRGFEITHPHYRRLPLIKAVDDFAHHDDIQHVKDWFEHSRYDDYWKSYGIKEKYRQIKVPAYFMTGWYDNLVHETFRNFTGFREKGGSEAARKGTKILVGPWTHGGSMSYPDLDELKLRWYDYWLKGIQNGIDEEPPIRIYVMGADKWRYENEWPLARTRFTKFYLHSNGRANSVNGDCNVTFRESLENSKFIKPEKVYEYTISLWETSMVFKAGHRIRLEISSSNFPRYARNQNIDALFGMSAEVKKAKQTIYHNVRYSSHLILPVIPR